MIKLIPVESKQQIKEASNLAAIIWREYYPDIIGQAQVDYMRSRFQSEEAITIQIQNDFEYFIIKLEDAVLGYLSVRAQGCKSVVELSKFYLLGKFRGQGKGEQVLNVLCSFLSVAVRLLRLRVNRNNHQAIRAYEKYGFSCISESIEDIGMGYVMDDLIFEKTL